MKQFKLFFLVLFVAVSSGFISCQSGITREILLKNFGDRAFKHIEYLSSMEHRQVGSENDKKTINYLKEQFLSLGLDVEIQPFQFESFEYSNTELTVNNKKLDVLALGLNPYQNTKFEGEAVIINWSEFDKSRLGDLNGQVVITNDWSAHFSLLPVMPKLIIYLNPSEFDKVKSMDKAFFSLSITSSIKKFESANVVAQIGTSDPVRKEILVTAHFDTYRRNNPGASDNASGVGVILELATFFKQMEDDLPCVIKFVAFGGEEIGIIGSRNYLYNNLQSLKKCFLLFNIDDVGGHRKIIVEKNGGVKGISETKGLSQIPEYLKISPWEGVNSMWRMLPENKKFLKIFGASNHPDWLVNTIENSIDVLGYEVTYTGTQGSDQLAFAQAGIVTSGVGIIGDHHHSPEDKPEFIDKESLKKAGEIAALVVINSMNRISENRK
ncbi:M28 family metallopeptidase [Bacteroidota bacterium]